MRNTSSSGIFAIALAALLCFGSVSCTHEYTPEMTQNLLQVQMQTEYVIDDVLGLLKSFNTDISSQISEIDTQVQVETEYVNSQIIQNQHDLTVKDAECKGLKDILDNSAEEYEKQTDFVNWITNKIANNTQKIEDYNKQSCVATLDFVEYLRNAQNSLNFIKFLRNGIQNYSFTQMKAITSVIQRYNQHDASMSSSEILQTMLLELKSAATQIDSSKYAVSTDESVSARTSDEIGTGHIDNNKGDLELNGFKGNSRDSLEEIKAELFKILDLLEAKVTSNLNDKISSQIALSETTAQFILFLEKETATLQKELVIQIEVLKQIEQRTKDAQATIERCYKEEEELTKKAKDIQTQHENYVAEKQLYRSTLVQQLTQLQAIIEIYENKVYTTGNLLKARYDDLLDNQQIDATASVDDRELTKEYDSFQQPEVLEGKVEQNVVPSEVQSDE